MMTLDFEIGIRNEARDQLGKFSTMLNGFLFH